VHPARLLAVHEVRGVEVAHLAGDLRGGLDGLIPALDPGGAALAGGRRAPVRLPADAERGHEAEARDHHAAGRVAAAHDIASPPSTDRRAPVMNEASSEHRNATAAATSSGVPSRPSGVLSRRPSRCSSDRAAVMSVVMYPGATALTRTP